MIKHNDLAAQETNYELYLRKQMEDSEFRAHYALALEKARLEILPGRLRDDIEEERERTVILRDLSNLSRYIANI
jgi:hypothetical protein